MKNFTRILMIIVAIITNVELKAQCFVYAGPDQYFCCPGTTTLYAQVSTTNVGCTCSNYTYSWSPPTGLSDPTSANPTATISNITYTVCVTAYTGHHCPAICCVACDAVSIFLTPGCCRLMNINEKEYQNTKINIYPNPTTNNLTIDIKQKLNKGTISMYDAIGKLVLKKEELAGENTLDLNVSNYPRGIYFIEVRDNDLSIYSGKIVLE